MRKERDRRDPEGLSPVKNPGRRFSACGPFHLTRYSPGDHKLHLVLPSIDKGFHLFAQNYSISYREEARLPIMLSPISKPRVWPRFALFF